MPDPLDESATLTDEDIETRPLGTTRAVTGDDSGDSSATDDTGDDSGDVTDTSDTGDDSGAHSA